MLPPYTCLSKDDCDPAMEHVSHLRHYGIIGSLGYLVNMTRSDLVFVYSELSKYVQRPDRDHMAAVGHVISVSPSINLCVFLVTDLLLILLGGGWTRTGLVTMILAALTLCTSS